jgi:hypothetical protein
MRGMVVASALAALLAGCAAHAPEPIEKLPPSQGLFTGPDGAWTVYRNDAERAATPPPEPEPAEQPEASEPPPEQRDILMCDRSRNCEHHAPR